MENNFNIEELFRNTLEQAEAQPPAGAWEAIQAKMGAGAAASGAGSAATGLGLGKIAAIVATALGVGLGVGYLAFNNNEGNQETKQPSTQQKNILAQPAEETTHQPSEGENVEITNISSTQKNDKIVSIVEVKKGEEKKIIRVEEAVPVSQNGSIVNQWLTPEKEKAKAEQMLQRILEEAKKDDNKKETTEQSTVSNKDNKLVVSTVDNEHVEAGIIATPDVENPMMIDFGNITEASAYEWNFGDDATSKQSRPTHVYAEPGKYQVTLKVYGKSGKVYSAMQEVNIAAREINPEDESSIGEVPDVFTPNGDGFNDEFFVTGKNIESFIITIVNAYGKTVYNSTEINQHWNGTDKNGTPVPVGNYTYIYKAIGKDRKPHQGAGMVTVSR